MCSSPLKPHPRIPRFGSRPSGISRSKYHASRMYGCRSSLQHYIQIQISSLLDLQIPIFLPGSSYVAPQRPGAVSVRLRVSPNIWRRFALRRSESGYLPPCAKSGNIFVGGSRLPGHRVRPHDLLRREVRPAGQTSRCRLSCSNMDPFIINSNNDIRQQATTTATKLAAAAAAKLTMRFKGMSLGGTQTACWNRGLIGRARSASSAMSGAPTLPSRGLAGDWSEM